MNVFAVKAKRYMDQGNYIEALKYYKAFNMEVNRVGYFEGKEEMIFNSFFNIAICAFELGRVEEALKMFKELYDLKPEKETQEIIKVLSKMKKVA